MKITIYILMIIVFGAFTACQQKPAENKNETVNQTETKEINNQTKNDIAPAVEREKFDQTRNPKSDLQQAITRAQTENKRIILDVGGEWCVWCRTMDNFFIQNPELAKLRDENFIWQKINFSEENENTDFLAAYPEVKGYPHLFVLEKDGALLYSKDTGELEDGAKSYDLQKFTDFLKEYSPKKDTSN